MPKFIDYYQLLEVPMNATTAEIKESYRKLSKRYHPDMNPNLSKEEYERFQMITVGYSVLINPQKRKDYNQEYLKYLAKKNFDLDVIDITGTKQRDTYTYVDPDKSKDSFDWKIRIKKMMQGVRDTYREVKQEEEKNSLSKRHEELTKHYERKYGEKLDTFPKEILFLTALGGLHIFYETMYQLNKFSHEKKEPFLKYVLRNRVGVISALAISTSIVGGMGYADFMAEKQQVMAEEEAKKNANVRINHLYQVEEGDSVSYLCQKFQTTEQDILKANPELYHSGTDYIQQGQILKIPYHIYLEDMDACTKTEFYDTNMSLSEFAQLHNTDIASLMALNPDAIIKQKDQYVTMHSYLNVPDINAYVQFVQEQSGNHSK